MNTPPSSVTCLSDVGHLTDGPAIDVEHLHYRLALEAWHRHVLGPPLAAVTGGEHALLDVCEQLGGLRVAAPQEVNLVRVGAGGLGLASGLALALGLRLALGLGLTLGLGSVVRVRVGPSHGPLMR